ncbi:probable protein phosphatase 2C 74 isoform X1 [Dendrobium catenatum]|uniref:probable protein phosphatase 2C 74 isoform X1 n=1 Tax=Dendrobium catenatum TaxID=906689 RepID=UPI0009F1D0E8|nr:probable protein phosphatase 2C 74 isoform X1 [Dendrobium catenatum]
MMVEDLNCLWTLLSILVHLVHVLRKAFMNVFSNSSFSHPPLSWKRRADMPVSASKKVRDVSMGLAKKDRNLTAPASASKEVVVEKVERFGGEELKEGECLSVAARKIRNRPMKLVIPQSGVVGSELGEVFGKEDEDLGRGMEVEGNGYWLVSRRGTRHRMEDGYVAITNIHEDSKQAVFGVLDGHGGRACVDFVSQKLGNNIIKALEEVKEDNEEDKLESAIKTAYLTTDREFLSQGVSSGTCVATILIKDGKLHVSNAGDCRVVMSKKGVADVLTSDHRPEREDERIRIENSGGYVSCYNGVWRVQDSLAISRAIGDVNMKKWIISEPETRIIQLNKDCEFLIMASDGLWDKVSNQEAVDVVRQRKNSMQACKDLVEISCSRGNRDDVTVMVVDLRSFCTVS